MGKVLSVLKYLAIRLLVIAFCLVAAIVLLQDFLILPYFQESLLHRYTGRGSTATDLGPNTTQLWVKTSDGRFIEVLRHSPPEAQRKARRAAIIFRGNGASLSHYLVIAESLAKLGVTSFLVNYPGMGDSKGWPSESKINQDAAQVWRHVTIKEDADPAKLIYVGYSFGTAPASWLAMTHEPQALVLLAPFPRLRQVVDTVPLYKYLSPLLWYSLPIEEYISEIKRSCLIIGTADNDAVIPKEFSEQVAAGYKGTGGLTKLSSSAATHDTLYSNNEEGILSALRSCDSRAAIQTGFSTGQAQAN